MDISIKCHCGYEGATEIILVHVGIKGWVLNMTDEDGNKMHGSNI